MVYGSAKAIAAISLRNDESAIAMKKNAKAALDPTKVFNLATHSYIDKDLYDQCNKRDKRSANPDEKN